MDAQTNMDGQMRIMHALVNLILLCLPAVMAGFASAHLSRTSKEEWALLAWVPPLPLLAFGVYVGVVQARDPTAANLWPFAMVFFAGVTVALFGLFLLARKFLYVANSNRPIRRRHDRTT